MHVDVLPKPESASVQIERPQNHCRNDHRTRKLSLRPEKGNTSIENEKSGRKRIIPGWQIDRLFIHDVKIQKERQKNRVQGWARPWIAVPVFASYGTVNWTPPSSHIIEQVLKIRLITYG